MDHVVLLLREFLILGVWDLGTIWVCNESIFHISRKDTPAVSLFLFFYFFGCWCTCGKWEGEDIPCVLGRAGLFTSFKYSVVRYTHHRSSHLSVIPFYFFLCSCFIFIIYFIFSPTSLLPLLSLCFFEYGAKFGALYF